MKKSCKLQVLANPTLLAWFVHISTCSVLRTNRNVDKTSRMDTTGEHLLTIRQAAQRLHVSPATVRRYIDRGLGAVRIGGRILTSVEAIQRFAKPVDASHDATLDKRLRDYGRRHHGLRI